MASASAAPVASPVPSSRHRAGWRLALLAALAAVVLTGVLLGAVQRLLAGELVERSLVRNQQRADVLGLQLQLALRDAVSQVRILARSPLLRPGTDLDRARAELNHLVERSPRFVWVGLVAPDGQVLAGSRGWLEGKSVAERPVFRRGIDGMVGDLHEAVLLAPLMAQLPGGATELIDIGEPVLNEAGEVVAVVTAHLGLDWVREQMALSLGEPEAAAAQGLRGLVVTEPGARSVVPGVTTPRGLPAASAPAQPWAADGVRWLAAQSPLRGISGGEAPVLPWRAVVMQDEAAVLAPLDVLKTGMAWIGLGAALLLAALGYVAGPRLLPAAAVPQATPSDADFETPPSAPEQTSRHELMLLNRRLLEREKKTGRKLARSLHDELGQTLAALRLHWEAYRNAAGTQREDLTERLGQLIVQANRQVRAVIGELRPPLLDELGLAAAIDNEIRQHQAAGEARVTLVASEEAQLQRWPTDIEYTVFMVAREALNNALRHAEAEHITLRLEGDEGLLELRVEDDGRGFVAAPGAAYVGLVAMRERALAVGAEVEIDGRPGHGTIVVLTWESAEALNDEPHLSH